MARAPRTPLLVGLDIAVSGNFWADKAIVATDISGIASSTRLGRRRRKCLVIDNESLSAQFAWLDLETGTLEPGDMVPLLPRNCSDIRAVGSPPDDGDPGPDEYILDGEGVAWLAPHYYVTGSHSIHDWKTADGAKRADYRRSAHLVARVDRDGKRVKLSYRLNELLAERKTFAPHFLKSPNKDEGINIEALTAWEGRLYFGFRSPVVDGSALILGVDAVALFRPDADLDAKTIRVPLGKDVGIRDLAVLPDGRFLILAGPKPDAYEGFTISLLDRKSEKLVRLVRLQPQEDEKIEGLFLAAHKQRRDGSARATILTLSDHPQNGNPRLFTLDIPAA